MESDKDFPLLLYWIEFLFNAKTYKQAFRFSQSFEYFKSSVIFKVFWHSEWKSKYKSMCNFCQTVQNVFLTLCNCEVAKLLSFAIDYNKH